jgi:aspartyl-tRNA(Asn)/glutamyl-tRNA(Gln) amidotransferase subunit C
MDVKHVAKLANLPLKPSDIPKLRQQFAQTLKYISKIDELDTHNIPPTSQVTGLKNVTRTDQIDTNRMLTQKQAMSGTGNSHNGYFVVPAIINES